MNDKTGPARIELVMTRPKFKSLVQRLGHASLSLAVARGRFTADRVWMRQEITGDLSRIEAVRRRVRLTS